MHSNTTNEIAVGSAGMLFAIVAVDDPAMVWLRANWSLLASVVGLTMLVATVTCLLSPAPSFRTTVGRVLASGIFGGIVAVIAGSLHSSGNGPGAIAAIVLLCGIGGWMVWLTIIEYAAAIRESPGARKAILTAAWNVVLRIFNIPRSPTNSLPEPTSGEKEGAGHGGNAVGK